MAVLAKDAELGHIYKPTKPGGFPRVYYTVHRLSVAAYIRNLERRSKALNGRECGLLASLKKHPDWILFLSCNRGTDPFTGERFEVKHPIHLPPDFRFRKIQTKPGYR